MQFAKERLSGLGLALLFVTAACHADGLLLLDNPAGNGEERTTYAALEGFQGSDAVAIRQFLGNWQGAYTPHAGNNVGIMAARSELGVQWQGYRLGALYRAQALVQTNRDTSDLVRAYNTSSGYDPSRSYSMDYQLNGFAASGLRLSKSLQIDIGNTWGLRWGLAGALMNGTQLKLETATGQAVALTTQDFNANAVMHSTNSALNTQDASAFNPFVQAPGAFGGQGYAVDAGVILKRTDGLQIEIAVNDLAGQIDWKNVPMRATNYNNATKSYDAAGYAHFSPTASALSSYVNTTQMLDPKLWLAMTYPLGGYQAQIATSYINDIWLPEANVAFAFAGNWRFRAGYDIRFGTVQLALQHPRFELSLRSDNLNLEQSKGYGVRMALNLPF